MSRKRFDEFYNFDGDISKLKEKIELIKPSGHSSTRMLKSGGFFFGVHDNHGNNKRLAVVFEDRETSEKVYGLLFGEVKWVI